LEKLSGSGPEIARAYRRRGVRLSVRFIRKERHLRHYISSSSGKGFPAWIF
jgi:hypothetical protein